MGGRPGLPDGQVHQFRPTGLQQHADELHDQPPAQAPPADGGVHRREVHIGGAVVLQRPGRIAQQRPVAVLGHHGVVRGGQLRGRRVGRAEFRGVQRLHGPDVGRHHPPEAHPGCRAGVGQGPGPGPGGGGHEGEVHLRGGPAEPVGDGGQGRVGHVPAHLQVGDLRWHLAVDRRQEGMAVAVHRAGRSPGTVDPGHRRFGVPVHRARGDDLAAALTAGADRAPAAQPRPVQALQLCLDPGGVLAQVGRRRRRVLLAGDDERQGLRAAGIVRVGSDDRLLHPCMVCPTLAGWKS